MNELPAVDDGLNSRLSVFVTNFVEYTENAIESCIKDAAVGAAPKPGVKVEVAKTATQGGTGAIAYGVGGKLIPPPVSALLVAGSGKVVEEVYGKYCSEERKEQARAVKNYFGYVPKKIRVSVFTEAAGILFMSYEYTFMNLTGAWLGDYWKTGLEKMAADAAERLINHVIVERDLGNSIEALISAICSGTSSNSSLLSKIFPDIVKTKLKQLKKVSKNSPNLLKATNKLIEWTKEGKTVKVDEEACKTSDIYGEAGIVTVTETGQVDKMYGSAQIYRRAFPWESLQALEESEDDHPILKYTFKLSYETTLKSELQRIWRAIIIRDTTLTNIDNHFILGQLCKVNQEVFNLTEDIHKWTARQELKTDELLDSVDELKNTTDTISQTAALTLDEVRAKIYPEGTYTQKTGFLRFWVDTFLDWGDAEHHGHVDGNDIVERLLSRCDQEKMEGNLLATYTCTKHETAGDFKLEVILLGESSYDLHKHSVVQVLKEKVRTTKIREMNLNFVDFHLNADYTGESFTILVGLNMLKKELVEASQKVVLLLGGDGLAGNIEKKLLPFATCIDKDFCTTKVLPKPRHPYIPRKISTRLTLKEDVFRDNCEDIFVFKGSSESELSKLIRPSGHNIQSSSSQQGEITGRYIHLDNENHWDDMVCFAEAPLHLVIKEDDQFVLGGSTRITDVILNNTNKKCRNKYPYVSENVFVQQIAERMSTSQLNGALLCDIPGMGKTWLLENLARNLNANAKTFIVLFTSLSKLSEELSKQTSSRSNSKNQALLFALRFCCAQVPQLETFIVHQHPELNKLRCVFVLDGFDEIAQEEFDKTNSFLMLLKDIEGVRFVISSRPNMRLHLEKTFQMVSYDIWPFDFQEKLDVIIGLWKVEDKKADQPKLEQLARRCVNSINDIQRNDCKDLLGVPLMCKILATVHYDDLKTKSLSASDAVVIKSIPELYQKYVEYCLNKAPKSGTGSLYVSNIYTYMALKLLFPKVAEVYRAAKRLSPKPRFPFGAGEFGILTEAGDFIHRTFAEYFVGKFFTDFWSENPPTDQKLHQEATICFVSDIIDVYTEPFQSYFVKFDGFSSLRQLLKPLNEFQLLKMRQETILRFMDSMYAIKTNGEERRHLPALSQLQNVIQQKVTHHIYPIQNRVFNAFLACIKQRLFSVTTLLADIARVLFIEQEITTLFSETHICDGNIETCSCKESSTALLLNVVALSGSTQVARSVFSMFGDSGDNCLTKFCREFPSNILTPLESAILQNDVDMVDFFINKLPALKRLVQRCLQGYKLTDNEITSRLDIMDRVISNDDVHLMLTEPINCSSVAVTLLTKFAKRRNFTLELLSVENKLNLIECAIEENNCEDIVTLTMLVFNHNIDEAREILRELDLSYRKSFATVTKFEDIKKFQEIFPDFTECCIDKWNYLHCAAYLGNLEWMQHLLQLGHDVNQRDGFGYTPLICISRNRPEEVAMFLIEHGATLMEDCYKTYEMVFNVSMTLKSGKTKKILDILKDAFKDRNQAGSLRILEQVEVTLCAKKRDIERAYIQEIIYYDDPCSASKSSCPPKDLVIPNVKMPKKKMQFFDDSYMLPTGFKGLFLLINILEFQDDKKREGAERDTRRLQVVFETLGYQVICETGSGRPVTRSMILQWLDSFKIKCVEQKVCSFGAFFGGMGCEGKLKMSDDTMIDLEEDVFRILLSPPKNSPNMQTIDWNEHWKEIPKMFFIQSSRNRAEENVTLPVNSTNCLISYACTSGQHAYRHSVEGSHYVIKLTVALAEFACEMDLCDILDEVQHQVKRIRRNQRPEYDIRGSFGKLYFNMRPSQDEL